MHTFKRSTIYSIVQFAFILIVIGLHFLLVFHSGFRNVLDNIFVFLQIIMALVFIIYVAFESFTKVEIDENYIYIRKIYGFKRFGLEEITRIEYKRLLINALSTVKVHNIDGDSIMLEYWYEDFSGLVSVLCKNTLSKNSKVLISDFIKRNFDIEN